MEKYLKLQKNHLIFAWMTVSAAFGAACAEPASKEVDDGLVFDVPRQDNTSGPSILDEPQADRGGFKGLCEKMQLFCNGMCLSNVGEQAGNCTLLQNNIGEAGSIAQDAVNLYYVAEKSEILKMDLQTLVPQSLVTGLIGPTALYATSGLLYFGNNPTTSSDTEADLTLLSDLRVVAADKPGVTVITENIGPVFDIFLSGDTLVFGAGPFDKGPLYSVSNKGGRWKKFGAEEILHLEVSGQNAYFSMNTETESGIFTASLSSPDAYSQIATGDITGNAITNFFVTADSAYWFALKALNTARIYTQVSLAGGGQKQELGSAGTGVLIAHNDTDVFWVDTGSVETGSNIMRMPIGGGEQTVLGNYETNELRAATADATHLYVAMGYARTGGILRFDL